MRRRIHEMIIEVDEIINTNPFGVNQREVVLKSGLSQPNAKAIIEAMIESDRIEKRGRLYFKKE